MKHLRQREEAARIIRQYLVARRVLRVIEAAGWILVSAVAWTVLGWSIFGSR